MKDEALLLTATIASARLCLRCVSIRSDIVEERLISVLQRVQRRHTIVENIESCDSCERRTVVYRLR